MLEGQRVDGDVDRALDGVLDGREPEVDLAGGGRGQDVGYRREGDQLGRRQVGLGEQGLLGEGAFGAEEGDPLQRRGCGVVGHEAQCY